MSEAILSLGSNLGDRFFNITRAIESIQNLPETEILKISDFYETEPYGVTEKQEKYINCCLKIETELSPEILMGTFLGIESALGRIRTYKFSPRTIDIDLLAYGKEKQNKKNLILPHPRMLERAFVLIPLSDICKNMKFNNINFKNIIKCLDTKGIKKISK